MSLTQNNKAQIESKKTSLKLALMPSIFAAGCCAITPIAFLFGFASSEFLFPNYVWYMRAGGVLLFVFSVSWFFYKQGIADVQSFTDNRVVISVTLIQTIIIALLIYLFLTTIAVPVIWTNVMLQNTACCGL